MAPSFAVNLWNNSYIFLKDSLYFGVYSLHMAILVVYVRDS